MKKCNFTTKYHKFLHCVLTLIQMFQTDVISCD